MTVAAHMEERMKAAELERLKALEAKATPGPWTSALTGRRDNKVLVMAGGEALLGDGDDGDCFISTRDLPFLAEARNALPALLREREELLKALKAVMAEMEDPVWRQSFVDAEAAIAKAES